MRLSLQNVAMRSPNRITFSVVKFSCKVAAFSSLGLLSYALASPSDGKICSANGFCFEFNNSTQIKIVINLDARQRIPQIDFQCDSGKCLGKLTFTYDSTDKKSVYDIPLNLKETIKDHQSVIYKKINNKGYEISSKEPKGYIYYEKVVLTKEGIIELRWMSLKTDLVAEKYIGRILTSLALANTQTIVKDPGNAVKIHKFSSATRLGTEAEQKAQNNSDNIQNIKSALNETINPANSFLYLGNNLFGTFDLTKNTYEVLIVKAIDQNDASNWQKCSYKFERKNYKFNSYFSGYSYGHIGHIGLKDDDDSILWFGMDSSDTCLIEDN